MITFQSKNKGNDSLEAGTSNRWRRLLVFEQDDPIRDLYGTSDPGRLASRRPGIMGKQRGGENLQETPAVREFTGTVTGSIPNKHQWPQWNSNWFQPNQLVGLGPPAIDCCRDGGSDPSPSTLIHSLSFSRQLNFQ